MNQDDIDHIIEQTEAGKSALEISNSATKYKYAEVRDVINAQGKSFKRLNSRLNEKENLYSDNDMLQSIQVAHKSLGLPSQKISRDQYEVWRSTNGEAPAAVSIIRRFNLWSEACERAGMESTKRARKSHFSEEDYADAIRQATQHLGYLPSISEYRTIWKYGHEEATPLRDDGHPSEASIRAYFQSWQKALKAAV